MVNDVGNKSLILREDAIVHFKDFRRLKYLEFGTRLLRLGKDRWTGDENGDASMPSMTKVIPHSL